MRASLSNAQVLQEIEEPPERPAGEPGVQFNFAKGSKLIGGLYPPQ